MKITPHQLPAAFALAEWRSLLAADPLRHIFATPEWCRLWWESFGEGRQDGMVLIFEDPDPVGLAALTVDQTPAGRRVRFLGGDDLTDYQGPVIPQDRHRPPAAEQFLRFLCEDPRGSALEWDYLEAKGLPVPFGFSEWLVEAADRLGLKFDLELHELTAVLMLPDSWSGYLAGLNKKKRHELERKMRRFDREAPGAVLRTSDAAHLEADIDTFIGMHRASAGEKGDFMLAEREQFFRAFAGTLHTMGNLSLDLLELGDRPLAVTISFCYDGVFYLYNSAYDLQLRPISPGLILVALLIRRCIEERYRRFDFLRGRERYKYDLGAEALPLHSIVLRRPVN